MGTYFTYFAFRSVVSVLRFIPFGVLYILADIIFYFSFHIARYRRTVFEKNIAFCFPHLDSKTMDELVEKAYRHFIDIILEGFKGLSYPPNKLAGRYVMTNPEVMDAYYAKGIAVTVLSQHYNNWEWAVATLRFHMKMPLTGIVKFLANPLTNAYMIRKRTNSKVSVVDSTQTKKYFDALPKDSRGIVFIADQNPSQTERSVAIDFLGKRAIPFHAGAGYFAHKLGGPVVVFDVRKIKRGHYALTAVPLFNDSHIPEPEEITHVYVKHLETLIRDNPVHWLWSHRRFKSHIDYSS